MPITLSLSITSTFYVSTKLAQGIDPSRVPVELLGDRGQRGRAARRPRSFRQSAERRGLLAKLDGGIRAGEPLHHPTRNGGRGHLAPAMRAAYVSASPWWTRRAFSEVAFSAMKSDI
jgi:hypothetical protein